MAQFVIGNNHCGEIEEVHYARSVLSSGSFAPVRPQNGYINPFVDILSE